MEKVVKVLSIDGGGMRGVIPAMVIAEIERLTGKPAYGLFDLIVGTSTGGILGACLVTPAEDGSPKYSGKKIVRLYEEEGPKIFSNSLWHRILSGGSTVDAKYPPDGADGVFTNLYGELRLTDTLTQVMFPSFELEMGVPYFFKSSDAKKDPTKNFLLRQAVMATTAAPTYFKPYVIESSDLTLLKHLVFVDGGVVANNPAMCAYVEAKSMFPDAEEYMLVSIGTGNFAAKQLYEDSKRWGAAQWVNPLLKILLTGAIDTVDHQLKVLHATPADKLNHYYRFQLPITGGEGALDDASETGLHKLELMAENLIRDEHHGLDAAAELLVK